MRFGRRTVLDEVALTVPAGSTTALLGRNGAGKSTLIRILTGLLPRTAGRVSVLGLDPGRHARAVKARIGYVPETSAFHPRWRVSHAIELTRGLRGRAWDRDEERRLLDVFCLPARERIDRLSKGARAKLALLLALAHRPPVVILDEPASGLDPVVKREVLATLVDAISSEGRTVLLSSHLIEDVERLADRVAFLGEGRILLEGGAEEVRRRARRLVVGPVAPDEALADLPGRPLVRRRGREAVLTYLRDGPEAAHAIRAAERFTHVAEDGINLEQLFVGLLGEEVKEATACGA